MTQAVKFSGDSKRRETAVYSRLGLSQGYQPVLTKRGSSHAYIDLLLMLWTVNSECPQWDLGLCWRGGLKAETLVQHGRGGLYKERE